MTSDQWRLFCAIELPAEVRKSAAAHAAQLRAAVPDARASWPRPENLHLTLKFFGEVDVGRVEVICNATARAANAARSFSLAVGGAGSFPPRGNQRVLWLGIEDPSAALFALHELLEIEYKLIGFERDARAFRPHLTIARIRSPQNSRTLADLHEEAGFDAVEFQVTELVVIRSELGSGGSRYTELARHQLGVQ